MPIYLIKVVFRCCGIMDSADALPARPTPRLPPTASNRGLSCQTRLTICLSLLLGVNRQTIANDVGCSLHAVINVAQNLEKFGSVRKVPTGILGRPNKISVADGEALFEHLVNYGWINQSEFIYWLLMERGVLCSQATVSRYLKKQRWNEKSIKLASKKRESEAPITLLHSSPNIRPS